MGNVIAGCEVAGDTGSRTGAVGTGTGAQASAVAADTSADLDNQHTVADVGMARVDTVLAGPVGCIQAVGHMS